MEAADCPNNNTFEAMLLGEIDEDARSRVLQHAETCEACASTLAALFQGSRVPTPSSKPQSRSAALPTTEFAPGDALTDQITIQARIGSGGMGTVYRAHHQGLGCAVAVKVLSAKLTTADAQTRLLREAHALAQLSTEHVVRIFDAGTLASGATYLVMELLPGETLRDYLQKKKTLEPNEVIDIAKKLCKAMAPAHKRGIVHRDLKPENVFILPDGSLRILDFGLSKFLAEAGSSDATSLTHSGAFLGTPLYVAPEQIREAQHVDARVDVWSIGIMAYEMLTGRTPFKRSSVGEVLSAILTEKAPPISAPLGLARLVARCLAPLDARPQDAAALVLELEALKTPSTQNILVRYVHIASIFAGAIAGTLYLARMSSRTPPAPEATQRAQDTPRFLSEASTSATAPSMVAPPDGGLVTVSSTAGLSPTAPPRPSPHATRDTLPVPTIVKLPPF